MGTLVKPKFLQSTVPEDDNDDHDHVNDNDGDDATVPEDDNDDNDHDHDHDDGNEHFTIIKMTIHVSQKLGNG